MKIVNFEDKLREKLTRELQEAKEEGRRLRAAIAEADLAIDYLRKLQDLENSNNGH